MRHVRRVQTSTHHLIPLKRAYAKLRYLIDKGYTFVGHGLSNDFRIINVYVPANQVNPRQSRPCQPGPPSPHSSPRRVPQGLFPCCQTPRPGLVKSGHLL